MSTNIILHGDSRTLADRIKTRPIDLIVTDPPYGMGYQSNFSTTKAGKDIAQKIEDDGDIDSALKLFVEVMVPLLEKCQPDCDVYVFAHWDLAEFFKDTMRAIGLTVPNQLIWNKGEPGLGDLDGNWGLGYEVILYGKRGRRKIPKRRGAVITCDKVPVNKIIHPTEKPVKLLKELITMSSNAGDFVVDPFSGSGAVSVACMELGRDSLAMDLNAEYVEKGSKRLEQEGFVFEYD